MLLNMKKENNLNKNMFKLVKIFMMITYIINLILI